MAIRLLGTLWVRTQTPADSFFGVAGHYPARRQKTNPRPLLSHGRAFQSPWSLVRTHILFGVPATAAIVNAVTVMIHDRLHKLASLY
jgi:hypothetical protein